MSLTEMEYYILYNRLTKKIFFVPQKAVAIFFSVSTMAAFAHLIYSTNFVVKIVVEFYLLSNNDSKLLNFFKFIFYRLFFLSVDGLTTIFQPKHLVF